jgi:predicted nucleotide-binding protein (sugar kinase/HSP70/actin superfamily)
VGIVGEIFVRCNPFANKGLVEAIEKLGGEAWLAPTAEWVLYTAWVERYRLRRKGMAPWQALKLGLRWWYMVRRERLLYRAVGDVLAGRHEPSIDRIAAEGGKYVPPDFEGETVLTLGRTVLFAREGVDLVVNCAPFGCMIGNVTSAFFEHMVDSVPIPIVDMFYDGDQDNSVLAAFMHEAVRRHDNRRATRSAQPSREMRVIAGDENP